MIKGLVLLLVITCLISFVAVAEEGNDQALQAKPSVFVGTAPGCAPTPPGSNIVTSAWLPGLGLPDDGSSNTPLAPSNRDPHFGLLLSKNGPTPDCSAAQATITGAKGQLITELGFDYRNGGHCGNGAPRFNVTTNDNVTHFFGCAIGGTPSPAPQDPLQWTRVRFTPLQGFPPVTPTETIQSIGIVYDEGTDATSAEDPNGIGLAVIDNIDVNGKLITRGPNERKENND